MIEPRKGANLLDVCAAPGGKAFYLALRYGVKVTACDVYAHKIELIDKGASRLGLNIDTVLWDACAYNRGFAGKFDRVLVDAPCSGFGALRKKPDIKLRRGEGDIEALALLQKRILHNAAAYVKPGGALVYCTCTLCVRENQEVVSQFLADNNFVLDAEREILPFDYNSDGFYAARMIKRDD
jgi:16S rRNA (cytosine967-C5)-methyltransferase